MNIFMTSPCPVEAAYDHCYTHCVKMILEVSQMLCTAHRVVDGDEWANEQQLYKATHKNHPCSIFVRTSRESYEWTLLHLMALHEYYERKNGRCHASKRLLPSLERIPSIPSGGVEPKIAAPEEYQEMAKKVGVYKAYQEYLKSKFAEWAVRERPIKVEWPLNNKPMWV